MPNTCAMVFITTPGEESGVTIAHELLDKRLAACVSIIPHVRSLYIWKGKLEDEQEALLIVKTTKELVEPLIQQVKEVHPYSVPEIISFDIAMGNPDYLSWIHDIVRKQN